MERIRLEAFSSRNRILLPILVIISLLLSLSCSQKSARQPPQGASSPQTSLPTGAQASAETEDGQWLMPAKNYASTRYSGLDQINTENVKNLKNAWTFSTGVNRGQEAAPLVVNNTMYVVTPYPNILYALDLSNPGATKWKYEPQPAAAAQGVACCDVVNRGAAYSNGRVFYNTLDNYTVAVDAETGREVWKTQLGDINKGETMTMAPLVVKDKVLVGNSGGEMGVRGWLAALDAASGKMVWRAYSTGPDEHAALLPADGQVEQYLLVDAVVVVQVVGRPLVEPTGLARIRVAREDAGRPSVIAGPLCRVPRAWVARAVEDEVLFRVV